MQHGEIYKKRIKVGAFVYLKTVRFCAVHGGIDLFTCADWDAKHGKCNRSEAVHGIGLEIPKAMKKAA